MSAEDLIKYLTISSLAAYVLSAVIYWTANKRAALGIYLASYTVNCIVFMMNWQHCGQPPLGNMHHIMVFLPMCLLPCFAFLHYREKLTWIMPYIGLASAIPLLGALFMKPDLLWKRVPALQSPWFVPHIVSYMIAYSLATVAFILLICKWSQLLRGTCRDLDEINYVHEWDRAAYRILLLAFPFFNFGLWSGALWAEEAWGKYWSWDNKETWALITWTLYLVYFHCRRSSTFRKWTNAAHFFAFAALITTLFLVNLWPKLSSVLHSYAS